MLESEVSKRKPFSKTNYWKLYSLGDDQYLLQMYNKKHTVRVSPSGLEEILVHEEPVAYTSYRANGTKKGFISSYLLRASQAEIVRRAEGTKTEFRPLRKILGSKIDKEYNIIIKILKDEEILKGKIKQAIRHDVREFCNFSPAKKTDTIKDHIILVETTVPEPRFGLKKPGTFDLVKDGKGQYENICLINIGIDPSKGCVSNITPRIMYDPKGKCSYCYAHQNGQGYIETIFDADEKEIISRINQLAQKRGFSRDNRLYLRIGQTVETNIPSYIKKITGAPDRVKTVLRALRELGKEWDGGIRVAMPTKIPEFDSEITYLLRETNTSVLVSIAYEELEPGIVRHGFDVNKRLELARQTKEHGINANLYIATDITRSFADMQDEAKKAYEFGVRYGIGIQFLDMRITKKKDAVKIGGDVWESLKDTGSQQLTLFPENNKWKLTNQNYLCAKLTSPDFVFISDSEIIEGKDITTLYNHVSDIRICSTHADDYRQCGGCFMDDE